MKKESLILACVAIVTTFAPYNVKSQTEDRVLVEWLFEPPVNPGTLNPYYVDSTSLTSAEPVITHNIFPPTSGGFSSGVSGLFSDRAVVRRDWPTDTSDYGDYYGFEMYVKANTIVRFDSVSLWLFRSGSGPTSFKLRSILNGFTSPISDSSFFPNQWHKWTVEMGEAFQFGSLAEFTFRVYGYGGSSDGTVLVDSVKVYGTQVTTSTVKVKAVLSGAFDGVNMMNDGLRNLGFVPLHDPYGSTDSISASVLATDGPNAIVDWVRIELRDSTNPSTVVGIKSALIQRDGDIVGVDGVYPPSLLVPLGSYYLALKHRNHLAVMTATPISLSDTIDFTLSSTPVSGAESRKQIGSSWCLWEGDVNGDNSIRYTGENNDRDLVLQEIGGLVTTNSTNGYLNTDVNMDGVTKYTGQNNDRDLILFNIGGIIPTNVRFGSVP